MANRPPKVQDLELEDEEVATILAMVKARTKERKDEIENKARE